MQSPLPLALAALICPLASAQFLDDTFEAGTNLDNWVAWDTQYSSISTGGGHPYEQLVLNNLSGSTTCQYVFVEPTGPAPYAHTGDWRAAGVQQVTADINIRQGRYGGIFCVFLVSDPDTPNDPTDDCMLILINTTPAPGGAGWTRYVFPTPTAETVAPPGWFGGNACSTATNDQAWNTVIQDVDRMFFVLDAIPGAQCTATRWDLGIDNISVQAGTLGTVYCTSQPNSTGARAELTGTGSLAVALNDLTFDVTSLPQGSFGYFVMSEVVARTAVFSGDLCLGGQIARFSLSVQQADTLGAIQFSPDVNALPQGRVFVPGETWNFQYWYRDIGSTANFSEAMAVTFE